MVRRAVARDGRLPLSSVTEEGAKACLGVVDTNGELGVTWVHSYVSDDKGKTFCVYEGPSEAAVRKAAELNKLPVDSVMEVPVTLLPK